MFTKWRPYGSTHARSNLSAPKTSQPLLKPVFRWLPTLLNKVTSSPNVVDGMVCGRTHKKYRKVAETYDELIASGLKSQFLVLSPRLSLQGYPDNVVNNVIHGKHCRLMFHKLSIVWRLFNTPYILYKI